MLYAQINDLKQKRGQLVADARKIYEKADAEKRDMSDEEKANYRRYLDEANVLKDKIAQLEELREAEREMGIHQEITRAAGGDPESAQGKSKERREAERRAFANWMRNGESGLSQRDREVLAEMRAAPLVAGTNEDGGYTIAPEDFRTDFIKFVDNMVFIQGLATVLKMAKAKKLTMPKLSTDAADADWTSELLVGSEETSLALGQFSLDPNPLAKYILISKQLIRESALDIESWVKERLGYKVGIAKEKAFMTGDGSGKPVGVYYASSSGISTGRDLAFASATVIDADTIKKAKYNLKPQYRANAKWNFNRSLVQDISLLKDGNGQYLWRPGLAEGEPDTIDGFPVLESEYTPATKTTGLYVGMLADWSKYFIVESLQLEFERLVELKALTNQIVILVRTELDGKPAVEEAFVRMKMG